MAAAPREERMSAAEEGGDGQGSGGETMIDLDELTDEVNKMAAQDNKKVEAQQKKKATIESAQEKRLRIAREAGFAVVQYFEDLCETRIQKGGVHAQRSKLPHPAHVAASLIVAKHQAAGDRVSVGPVLNACRKLAGEGPVGDGESSKRVQHLADVMRLAKCKLYERVQLPAVYASFDQGLWKSCATPAAAETAEVDEAVDPIGMLYDKVISDACDDTDELEELDQLLSLEEMVVAVDAYNKRHLADCGADELGQSTKRPKNATPTSDGASSDSFGGESSPSESSPPRLSASREEHGAAEYRSLSHERTEPQAPAYRSLSHEGTGSQAPAYRSLSSANPEVQEAATFRSLAPLADQGADKAATFRTLSDDANEAPAYCTLSSGTVPTTAEEEADAIFESRVRKALAQALAQVEMATRTEGAYPSLSGADVDEASTKIPLPSQVLRCLQRALK